jgi:hypothetical protein
MAATRVNVERRIDMILNGKARATRRWMWLPIGSAVAAWGAFVLTGAAPASGAAAKKASSDDPLTWFATAIEDQVNQQSSPRPMVVVMNKIVEIDGDEQSQMEVRVIEGDEAGVMPFDIPLHGGMAPKVFIARTEQGDGVEGHWVSSLAFSGGHSDLPGFLTRHPAADANADGTLSPVEHDAYLAALAMSDPTAVMNQFPKADRNGDGALDANEAARLVTGGPEVDLPPAGALKHGMMALRADGAPAAGMLKVEVDAESTETDGQPRIVKMRTRIVGPDGQELTPAENGIIELNAEDDVVVPADGERRVIVKKIVKEGDGPAEVSVTVNGQPVEASAIEDIAELKDLPCIQGAGADGAVRFLRFAGAAGTDAVDGGAWMMKVGAPAAHWLVENITADVTAADVAKLVPTVEQAPLAQFLEMNPDSDANHDGKVTAEERAAFIERHMSKARQKLLERFPDADANADGLLTNDELHQHFKNRGAKQRQAVEEKPEGVMGPPLPDGDGC